MDRGKHLHREVTQVPLIIKPPWRMDARRGNKLTGAIGTLHIHLDETALVHKNLGSQGSKSTIKLDAQDEKRLRSLGKVD